MLRALRILVLVLAYGMVASQVAAQQGGTTRYVYDDNGRLIAVVSPTGEAAVYEYDAAGNFTAIRRISADTLVLLAFFPHEGGAGDQVTFVGTGFNAGVTSVSFNGASATIIEVSPSAVIAEVPDEATTGPVTINTPRGTLTTPVPFTIVARVRVLPSSVTMLAGDSFAFTAVVGAGGDQSVTWSVNGIIGGNNTVGTISSSGLYIAPNTLTGNTSLVVAIRATSIAQPSLFGEAQVRVLNPNSLSALLAPSVSVRKGDPRGVAGARAPVVSVRRGAVINGPNKVASPLVSVRRGSVINGSNIIAIPLVSIRRGTVINGPSTITSPLVSVRFGFVISGSATTYSPFVSVTTGPNISAIAPVSVARGATVALTITGNNLSGATAIRFIDANGAVDSTITASNLTVNADGTQLTATLTVGGSAALGQRVVVVTTSSGTTPAIKVGANTITIQ